MNIVIEGPDGSGKSTLARFVGAITDRVVTHSPGPARTQEDMEKRAEQFLSMQNALFDRHCIVSEFIYGAMRGYVHLGPEFTKRFLEQNPLFIYCRGSGDLERHQTKSDGYDTSDHLAMIQRNHEKICGLYDQWALHHAHAVYRIGDDMRRIGSMIKGVMHNAKR